MKNHFLIYRVVITNILGYNVAQLQKGFFPFWTSVKSSVPDESVYQFLDRCKKEYPGKNIRIIKKTLQS